MLTQHLLLLSPEQDLETIKQTNLGQLGAGTTKDEGRRTNDLGASAAVVPASKQIFCLLSIAVAGVTGEGWSTLLGFSSRVSAVGLSKVHLPWLRHRNIPQACNDNISRPSPPPLTRKTSFCISLVSCIYILALGELENSNWGVPWNRAEFVVFHFHFAALMKL